MNRRRVAGWAALGMCGAVLRLVAQGPPPQTTPPPASQTQAPQSPQQPTFRARVDSVSVDVAVTDKQGHPVKDLTAQDFEIRESSKPQTIETFKYVELDDSPVAASALPEIQSIEDQQQEVARENNRLIVIFLDDYHTHRADSLQFRLKLARWVRQLGPRDIVAVTTPLAPIGLLTFAHDHEAAAQTIEAFEGRKYDYTPRSPVEAAMANVGAQQIEQMRNSITISALDGLCAHLGTLRDGRKTLLYVGEGLTGDVPNSSMGSVHSLATPMSSGSFTSFDLLQDMQQVFATATRNNTLIYTIDPRGLAAQAFEPSDHINASQESDRQMLNEENDSLRIIADSTGGRAILGSNEPGPALKQLLQDSSAYYLLGYTSTEKARDGKFHSISVKVNRKDVEVRARKGYWAYSADEVAKMSGPAKPAIPADVQEAVDALDTPGREHPVHLWLGATRGPDGKGTVTLSWEAVNASARHDDAVDHIVVTANSVYGDKVFTGTVPRDPNSLESAGHVTFDAPPGPVRVRITAESASGVRLDTDDRDVDVPDFTAVGPLITTPMVFRARTARDVQKIRADNSPVPTPDREFSRTEQLLIRFQAYGPGGTRPTVTFRLLNQQGHVMAELPAPNPVADGFESVVGLGTLAPGAYVFEITATSGDATKKALIAITVTA